LKSRDRIVRVLYRLARIHQLILQAREYLDDDGSSRFADWFNGLDTQAALKVTTYLARLETGNTSALKSLGKGLWECRIHWGPGLRIYLGRDGDTLVILFGGGTKRRQSKDIEKAMVEWTHYKKRKKDR